MKPIHFKTITQNTQIETVADLAKAIWKDTYSSILSNDQIEYMLEEIQSKKAIANQINEQGYQYYFLLQNSNVCGYMAIVPHSKKDEELFLSKIYLLPESQGKGITKKAFLFLEDIAQKNNLKRIWLTVNKNNHHAQKVYEHYGFTVSDSVGTDIGNHYVMDDYIMEKFL